MTKKKTLIICDVQPNVVQKLPQHRQFVDLVHTAMAAARMSNTSTSTSSNSNSGMNILYTMLYFDQPSYAQIPISHPRLGILRKLGSKNSSIKWFTSKALSVPTQLSSPLEKVLTRTTFLPQANDEELLQTLRNCCCGETHEFILVGYGPTVQALCSLLGDVVIGSNSSTKIQVTLLRECIRDEIEPRCQAFLNHGLLFNEEVVSLVDFLESLDLLPEKIIDTTALFDDDDDDGKQKEEAQQDDNVVAYKPPPPVKYVSDCGRGGHLSLFLPYLLRDYGYCLWPTQPWYKELSLESNKEFHCPLGRRMVDLCDEPQFSQGTKFFLAGRHYLDEKNLLHDIVPEMMPPTFATVEEAQEYRQQQDSNTKLVWFLKKVNQNGGRAITITHDLPSGPLEEDDQLQVHIPRPLLYHENHQQQGKFKCHVKTYQYLACNYSSNNDNSQAVEWRLYMHNLFYLATAYSPWSPEDPSDDAQITTMRTHRLYPDHPWRVQWNLTERIHANMATVVQRAVEQGKLQAEHYTTTASSSSKAPPTTADPQPQQHTTINTATALQFEVNSADWMLDEDGRMYLIEINGIPVLYDAGMPQELCTKGLNLYDRLYKENPETAVVNDHDLLQEAIGLALTGKVPKSSLWVHIATTVANDQ